MARRKGATALRVSTRTFHVHKRGGTEAEYEDAFFPDEFTDELGAFRCAVADGASESAFANIWAQLLVRGFGIGVAGFPEGHPDTLNRLREMEHLKAKVDAGADYVCTQMFFDNHEFYDWRERCELAGIRVPLIAGIMPIVSIKSMKRMADLAAGTRFPARLLRGVDKRRDDPEAVTQFGVLWATEQCRDLLDHDVRGIHFYTLNRSDATKRIYETLGAKDSTILR